MVKDGKYIYSSSKDDDSRKYIKLWCYEFYKTASLNKLNNMEATKQDCYDICHGSLSLFCMGLKKTIFT